ncbi:MAG: hypothetical protein VZR54_07110 [Ruminococcus sp.]|nr:hypothetical protein [Ruminococcus sp.]
MIKSVFFLLVIGAVFALVGDIFSNLIRIDELRSIKRDLAKYERAFAKIDVMIIRETVPEEKETGSVELVVKDETVKDDRLKFGDE